MTDDWQAVDDYLVTELVHEDANLVAARTSSRHAGQPAIEVSPNQGKLLALLAELSGARRVLEIGTLGGYSAIWLARAVGGDGRVITLEIDPVRAGIARKNLIRAGVDDRVDVVEGPAERTLLSMIDDAVDPFDLVFIDADKPSNPRYLELVLRLVHPGSVIVGDNVVRGGAVVGSDPDDPDVAGIRAFLHDIGANPALSATALQTVGSKGWDGFSIAIVH